MATGLQEQCVTEIRCASTSGFGSGYLIRPDLVLTARHVIAVAPGSPAPTDVEIRPLEDAHAGRGWRNGTVIWPAADRWADLWALDLVLVEISADEYTRKIASGVLLGRGDLPVERPMSVTTVGFPRFKANDVVNVRESEQVFGRVALLSGSKQQVLEIEHKGRGPKPDQDWHGISGAALFAQQRLVGVVNLRVVDSNIDFKAVRMEAALDHSSFKAIVGDPAGAAPRGVLRPPALEELGGLVYLVDRDRQERAFKPLLRTLLTTTPSRPLCCVIVGESCHWPDDLITRFSLETIPHICQRPHDPSEIRPIAWPRRVNDPESDLKALRDMLWSLVADSDEDAPIKADPFRERFDDVSRPHLFKSEIAPEQWSAEQALLLSSWLAFWGQLSSTAASRTPVHFIIIKDANLAAIRSWLSTIPVPPAVELCVLPELELCYWQDIEEWVHRRVKLRRPTITEDFERLKIDLEDELGAALRGPNSFSVADLKSAVRRVTKRN